jgi:hypothetical protein
MSGMLSVDWNRIDFIQYSDEAHIEALGTMGSNRQWFSERNFEEACAMRMSNVSQDRGIAAHLEPVLSWPKSCLATCQPAPQ